MRRVADGTYFCTSFATAECIRVSTAEHLETQSAIGRRGPASMICDVAAVNLTRAA